MSGYFGIDSNSSSSFFGSMMGTGSSSSGSLSIGDYSLIKNGSYKKLLKKYYAENPEASSSSGAATSTKPTDSTTSLLAAKTSSYNLKDAAETMKNLDYDQVSREDMLKDAKSFVESYNATLTSLTNLDSVSVLQNGVWMTGQMSKNSDLLKDIGIKIGTDNKLSIDEDTFKSAKLTSIKGAFAGSNSISDSVSQRANQIYTLSGTQALINQRTSSYSSNGSYNAFTTSQLFNSLL